jgi:hypothetical protein
MDENAELIVPVEFIESLQPYYSRGTINTALGFLANLSNIDKHRYLNRMRTRVRKREAVRFASGMRGSGHMAAGGVRGDASLDSAEMFLSPDEFKFGRFDPGNHNS